MSTDRGDQAVEVQKRKLIEVALPLEVINRESARESYIYKGNPSSVHKWFAQRPLAAARAVLFAQLVDDPCSYPDRFSTEDAQRIERERLHGLIERLVVWENTRDQELFAEAHEEILKSTDGKPPPILDPFAGGGTIPLEAQRLGLEAHASDLNPVAVLINKALIEIPPKFAGRPPVFPGLADGRMGDWEGATGLAADVRAYGEWIRGEAESRIGDHYPTVKVTDSTEARVIAWIWVRTVTCANPACGIEMPLARTWWLGKRKGKEAWVRPLVVHDSDHPSGRRVTFEIGHGRGDAPSRGHDGTVGRNGATCVACGAAMPLDSLRARARDVGLGVRLMAIVAESDRRRIYLPPDDEQQRAAAVKRPEDAPEASLPAQALGFRVQKYGMTCWSDLFTNRQLLTMTTFCALVMEARQRVLRDVLNGEASTSGHASSLEYDPEGYADAVSTYLAFALSKHADYGNSLVVWYPQEDRPSHLFTLATVPMAWDFCELNPLMDIGGAWSRCLKIVSEAFEGLGKGIPGVVAQRSAEEQPERVLISTDPPYYDNIGYADLSDFFYVWLRRSLRNVYPELLSTMLVPKAEELVANPYRHEGEEGAKTFFEDGFRRVFAHARTSALPDYPVTVYYAFKQSDASDDGDASTGWETLLDGMIKSGWAITATWPLRSERSGRMRDIGSNALASSIILALRPRPDDAPTIDRRGLIAKLHNELPDALRRLQQGAIAPVDLPQAAIGPGMAVFSRYAKVVENDGTSMSVRSALARINEILDQVLNEQEGDFDPTTRFAIAWYRQNGYTTGDFGVADSLARARNTVVETLERDGILTSAAGKVTLLSPASLPENYEILDDDRVGIWEALHHLIAILGRDGLQAAGGFLARAQERPDGAIDVELVKELAFLLFSIAEKNGWTQDAIAFNTVATAWPEIIQASRAPQASEGTQAAFAFEED
jgi:putative DNA methylase